MFERGSTASSSPAPDQAAPDQAAPDQYEVVRELQARIRGMQRNRLDTRAIPTHPTLEGLLPGGALAAGGVYRVQGSTLLALALLQGPSAAGAWCAVVGMPDLGVEAAACLGLDLERLVLVPHPGDRWLTVVSALVDVVSVVLVRPPAEKGRARVGEAAAGRLASRLRQREVVLVAAGDWPHPDATLGVTESAWAGIGAGSGHLTARQATVGSVSRSWEGRVRSRRVWLPGPDALLAPVESRLGESRLVESRLVESRPAVPV